MDSELAQALAGLVQIVVFFCEAEAQQILTAAGAEECGACHRCYTRGG
jgi:hypothetical protein